MKKILLFGNTLRIGGLERVTLNLSNGLSEKGYEVALVLVSAEGKLLNEVNEDVQVVDLKANRVLTSAIPLRSCLRAIRPDVSISMGAHVNAIIGLVSLTLSEPPALVYTHHSILRRMDSGLKHTIFKHLVHVGYRQADEIVCVSRGVLNKVQQEFGVPAESSRVIYNPVLTNSFWSQNYALPDHPWFGEGDEIPVVLSAGRHSHEKDFWTLIDAFIKLRENREARLVILGHGPEHESLLDYIGETIVAEDIHLTGYVESVYPYMKHADVFVLSSKSEGFGMVLVEAMGVGCPVVSTDCPSGPAEILDDGKYGPLSPVGDAEQLSRAIENAIESPLDEDALLSRAKDFSVEKSVNEYNCLIADLI